MVSQEMFSYYALKGKSNKTTTYIAKIKKVSHELIHVLDVQCVKF